MRKKSLIKHVGVLFDDETHQRIIRITDAKEIPISKYLRLIVTGYLDQLERHGRTQQ